MNGAMGQRLRIRFPGQGIKTLSTLHAELERIKNAPDDHEMPGGAPSSVVRDWDRLTEEDWLQPLAQKKIREAMIRLPEGVSDPFRSPERRIALTLELYRFEPTGRSLIDWAVAQTGLNDPLSRFNRHELEQFFDRWAFERDAHLNRLLAEESVPISELDRLLDASPPAARVAVRRTQPVR